MDFGRMLDGWIDAHGVEDKDGATPEDRTDAIAESARIRALPPQDSIDLHGLTAREAEAALRRFLAASSSRGLSKILVIHGKGGHSAGGAAVLAGVVRQVLERSAVAGSFGLADRKSGGSGATWVALRRVISRGR